MQKWEIYLGRWGPEQFVVISWKESLIYASVVRKKKTALPHQVKMNPVLARGCVQWRCD